MNIIFDLETTGLPLKNADWKTDYMMFPYIVQISWKRSNVDLIWDYIIKPDGYEIPIEATNVHGISTEKAIKEGTDFYLIAQVFIDECIQSDNVIGHNIYFDTSIFKANILRSIKNKKLDNGWIDKAILALDKSKRIDTMMKTISFCSIPFANGKGKKWPTLIELYSKLFGETFPAHNSKEDVLATERCYNELVRLKII